MLNKDIIGTTFASWCGMGATYINTSKVPKGFRIMCESMPHHGDDHIVYGRRVDKEYVGVGQPYPMSADKICDMNNYCRVVGLTMTITGGSTWNFDCLRILFQRDDDNIERFNIAIQCSRWSSNFPMVQGATKSMIKNTNRRFIKKYPDTDET